MEEWPTNGEEKTQETGPGLASGRTRSAVEQGSGTFCPSQAKQTNQISSLPVEPGGFLLVRGVTFGMASGDAPRCLTKILPEPVRSRGVEPLVCTHTDTHQHTQFEPQESKDVLR